MLKLHSLELTRICKLIQGSQLLFQTLQRMFLNLKMIIKYVLPNKTRVDTDLGISTLSETGFSGKWTLRGPRDIRGRFAEDTGDPWGTSI